MQRYGQIIDDSAVIDNLTDIHRYMSNYFDNPILTKNEEKGISSIYYAKVNTGLMLDNKYLVVIVNRDSSPIGTKKKLSEMSWASLQTRIIRDNLNCDKFSYRPKKVIPFTDTIKINDKNDKMVIYSHSSLKNISITLLYVDKTSIQYPSQGTLLAALETYKTILTIL
jgi:hypothetical protein